MTSEQWKNYLVVIYKAIKNNNFAEDNTIIRFITDCNKNINLEKVTYYIWKYYLNHKNNDDNFWKAFFRKLLDFTAIVGTLSVDEAISSGQMVCDYYNNNDITNIIYYIIKETKYA